MINIAHYQRKENQNYNEISPQTGQASSKSLQTVNVGEGVEKKERSCTVGENVIDTTTVEDSMEIPLKTRNKTTI